VRRLVAGLREQSARPLLVATDEEPGRVSSFGAVLGRSSSARTLAQRGTAEDVEAFALQLAVELSNLGIDADFAPVADVDEGPASGVIGDRSFSGHPSVAADYALAFSRGLWRGGIVPVPKHFPGHGRSPADSHRRLAVVESTLEELRAHDLVPFRAQIRGGARMMMLGHVAYRALDADLPASLSPRAYALLRSMGFDGVAITDSLGMGAVNLHWGFGEAAVLAVAAGADAVLATDGRQARLMRDSIVSAVVDGRLPDERLSEAAGRMVELKGGRASEMSCRSAFG
jgi:beta-N-acetylhexosaminidase